jgi:hypothetical protein
VGDCLRDGRVCVCRRAACVCRRRRAKGPSGSSGWTSTTGMKRESAPTDHPMSLQGANKIGFSPQLTPYPTHVKNNSSCIHVAAPRRTAASRATSWWMWRATRAPRPPTLPSRSTLPGMYDLRRGVEVNIDYFISIT